MSDITETMTVKNGQAAVKTVTVAGKLSPKTSATDTIALVETSDGKQAALKVYNINGEGGGGGELPDNVLVNNTDYNTSIGIGSKADSYNAVAVGTKITSVTNNSVTIGHEARTNVTTSVAIGYGTYAQNYSIALGANMSASAEHSIQIGSSNIKINNTDPNTFKVYNGIDNFEMMDADGKIPLERLTYVTNQIGDISTALTAILGE